VAKAATKTTTKKAPARKPAASKAAGKTAAKTAKAAKAPAKTAASKATGTRASAAKAPAKAPARTATKAAKSAASTGVILTLRHIAEKLSETHELPKRQANEMLTQIVEMITKSLKKGEKIRLSGLGILQVRKRAARMGRNPQTGEPVKIKASKKVAFRPAKDLKEAI
jgi:DNA-binding protein HU-beta